MRTFVAFLGIFLYEVTKTVLVIPFNFDLNSLLIVIRVQ